MEPVALLSVALSITNKLMDKLPDYDQRKKQQFHDLNLRYEQEKKKTYPERDDDLIMNLRDELSSFLSMFDGEVK